MADTVKVDVALPPDNVTDAGPKDMLGPEGEVLPVKLSVSEKPFRPETFIIMFPVEP